MEEIIRFSITILSIIASIVAVIKWGIEKYFQKNEEVLKLKEQITSNAINSMEKTMDKFSGELKDLSSNMADLEGHLIMFQSRLNDYDSKNNAFLASYTELTSEVRKKLKILESLEINDSNNIVLKKKN